jgi:hypothetical protein
MTIDELEDELDLEELMKLADEEALPPDPN